MYRRKKIAFGLNSVTNVLCDESNIEQLKIKVNNSKEMRMTHRITNVALQHIKL